MSRTANYDLVAKCVDYIQTTYKFMDYLEKYDLLEGAVHEGYDRIAIRCPFHEDDDPSCKIDLNRNIYNSFCCEHKGNLIGFISSYSTEVLGNKMNYMQTIERLLQADPIMQLRIGAKTIFVTNTVTLNKLEEKRLQKRVSILSLDSAPSNFMELSKYLRKSEDISKIKMAIDLMQSGLDATQIYNNLHESDVNKKSAPLKNFEKYDIEELIMDND